MSITLRSNICSFFLHTLKCSHIYTKLSNLQTYFKMLQMLDQDLTRLIMSDMFTLKTSHTTVTVLSSINFVHTNVAQFCDRMSFLTSSKFGDKNHYFYWDKNLGDKQPWLKSNSLANDLASIPNQASNFCFKGIQCIKSWQMKLQIWFSLTPLTISE